jgi:hypothetical protein
VQLLGLEVLALLQVELHQRLVDLDHLVDDLAVGLFDRLEKSAPSPPGLKKQSMTRLPPSAGRLIGRHSAPKVSRICCGDLGQVDAVRVDAVDDEHAAEVAVVGGLPHALGHRLDAVLGVDDDGAVSTALSTDRCGRGSPGSRGCRAG